MRKAFVIVALVLACLALVGVLATITYSAFLLPIAVIILAATRL